METRRDRLFIQYAEELGRAKALAERWWNQLIASEAGTAEDLNGAAERLKRRWPLGPAAHPYIVAVIRKYWLACVGLNQEIAASADDSDEIVSPPVFLCEFLMDGKHEKLAAFIAPLTYWPIGMGDDDELQ
jgi:hypothetical protein